MVMGELAQETGLLVIGGGPGGYSAAFRAADLGLDVTLVEIAERPGGVCLFRGCIPSKALLHVSELLTDTRNADAMGLHFNTPQLDLDALRQWKQGIIDNLSAGLATLTHQRGIQYMRGQATFEDPHTVRLSHPEISRIKFKHAIIATGSHALFYPGLKKSDHKRIMTSADALSLMDVPPRLLVIGGGYIGLELGSVYSALGSRVTLVELGDRLLAGVDEDLVRILGRRLETVFESVLFNTRVHHLQEDDQQVQAIFETGEARSQAVFDRALVAIGRKPNTAGLGLEKAGVKIDDAGFIVTDQRQQTSQSAIFAVGDVTGGVMLAHKAIYQGKIAAEVVAGRPAAFDVRAMPAVVFTDPQVAWAGKTEEQVRTEGLAVDIRRYPWKVSGRALTMARPDGLTKMIVERSSRRILGVGIVGRQAEALIAEAVLAIEMGALADDVALSVHPHPTLSETEAEVAGIFLGSTTHIMSKK